MFIYNIYTAKIVFITLIAIGNYNFPYVNFCKLEKLGALLGLASVRLIHILLKYLVSKWGENWLT